LHTPSGSVPTRIDNTNTNKNKQQRLAESIAPSVSGDYTVDIKKALACQLMSGSRKVCALIPVRNEALSVGRSINGANRSSLPSIHHA
jgi:hypothetical protein